MLEKLTRGVAAWYRGRVVVSEHAAPGTLHSWRYERHWTADVVHAVARFWLRHWQWTIGTAVAVAGLYVGYLAAVPG